MVLWKTVNETGRAFDLALSSVGGSRPMWFILLALKADPVASQREIAATVGIQGATLTHHLTAMEADGLLTRRRDPANRRVHLVELTDRGEAAFQRMRDAALDYDRKLRQGIPDEDIDRLRDTLDRLRENSASIMKSTRGHGTHT
ncbi:MarR family winged helix-turn-helix transcriptional regulator [Phytoactinopolyspora halotolerans]|uniref:Winged helix-turn-helix transcriptional regulator n=1 Tax=Phytoactinopolyspora halotolerans TaxID=1981512 RepID=A0A6L9S7Q2_9ACTN|nr:winged helix-turn-helix transcriptional regulator [Phytoactinopolyspora halotolerans]